jgi:hypothetical protein
LFHYQIIKLPFGILWHSLSRFVPFCPVLGLDPPAPPHICRTNKKQQQTTNNKQETNNKKQQTTNGEEQETTNKKQKIPWQNKQVR